MSESIARAKWVVRGVRNRQEALQLDSVGGAVDVRVTGLPVGLGEPVFGKLKALLSSARNPPVTNSRSLYPNCCSMNAPTVEATVVLSRTSGMAPAVTVVAPGGRFSE